MHHLPRLLLLALALGCAATPIGMAFQTPTSGIKVCSLLPRAEVKKLIGAGPVFDMVEPEEEAVAGGSSCNYPEVLIQVIPFSQSMIDSARKRGALEAVPGLGDEAYLFDNRGNYAELYVKIGPRLLTLQRSIGMGKTVASVRSGVIDLGKALVPKLR